MLKSKIVNNYGSFDVTFKSGKGSTLTDVNGKKYIDFLAGIAVNALGHNYKPLVKAISKQAATEIHICNYYTSDVGNAYVDELLKATGFDGVYFGNSGAEANEGAMKVAVRYTGKKKVLSALNSFHGRTAAALGATGQTKYQDSFQPLISDCFDYFDFGSCESVKSKMDKDVAAVIVEPVQCEGGVRTVPAEFFKTVRDLCTDYGAMMIVDEVQTGMGRTGKWFGIENFGVVPDIMSLAKALGGGVPVGAVVTTDEISKVMTPGTHGTTFGGTPLVCTAVKTTIDIMKEEKLVENSASVGKYLKDSISEIESSEITDVRGYGLVIGVEMKSKAPDFQKFCRDNGVLVNVCHGNVVRLIPPLIIGKKEADMFTGLLKQFLN